MVMKHQDLNQHKALKSFVGVNPHKQQRQNTMKKQSDIRFVKQTDLEELITLCEEHALYEKADFSKEGKKDSLQKHLFSQTPTLYCLVLELDSKLIGYATYMKQFSTWDANFYVYMDCLFLNEKSRGLGLGEEMMNKIKEESIKLGCELIQWQTPTFNTGAIKFYNRIGATSKDKKRFFLDL